MRVDTNSVFANTGELFTMDTNPVLPSIVWTCHKSMLWKNVVNKIHRPQLPSLDGVTGGKAAKKVFR